MINEKLREKIIKTLENDGVICFVTDTVWGLGCLPTSKKAVEKIYAIKHRDTKKPLILMSNKIEHLKKFVKPFNNKTEELIEKYFPGALTLVLEKNEYTPDFMTSNMNTVGIRIPDNEIFQEICSFIPEFTLATTSANLSSQPAALTFEEAKKYIGNEVDLIIEDYGFEAKGVASTVLLVAENEIKILRQGAIEL